jgi:hypothetical protein
MKGNKMPKAKQPVETYSIDKGATLCGCDRRTLSRALSGVPADAHASSRKRFTLPTMTQALLAYERKIDARNGRPRHSAGTDHYGGFANLDADLEHDCCSLSLFADFNRDLAAMEAAKTIAARRKLISTFVSPVLDNLQREYRAYCESSGAFYDAGTRSDLMFSMLLQRIGAATGWSTGELYSKIYPDMN